ncbi:MAG: segregation/condensation protein A [Gammaproteobacteria bacterium]|nr:segregation/condensation protein A [Gammaproteobacteria bacterium]MCP5407014.1 segregation/condensation protein A [Chromatiaceae bacterium]MCP5445140.1 segregation/condensation protein A [Chromatiaceae bacterium]
MTIGLESGSDTQHLPEQEEMPFAVVQGVPWSTMPKDLYIPPDALEIFLDAFEGPLDLLLYLIKRQNLDILEIPVAQITAQYMEYVRLMKELKLELAAEYLVMAAMLAEIKSRMLLPQQPDDDEEEGDPRAELIRRLQEYERYKQAAEDIDALPRLGRDIFQARVEVPDRTSNRRPPDVELRELLSALSDVMQRAEMFSHHRVESETLSVRERMSLVLAKINASTFTEFTSLFPLEEGRQGVVVTFLAILELIKSSLIELVQAESFGPIHVKAKSA